MTADEAVWQGLDQSALDRAYDQAAWAPNMQAVLARYAQRSESTRERLGAPRRMAYGTGPNEALDFFPCGRTGAPLHAPAASTRRTGSFSAASSRGMVLAA